MHQIASFDLFLFVLPITQTSRESILEMVQKIGRMLNNAKDDEHLY